MERVGAWVKPPELHLHRCPAPREQFRFHCLPPRYPEDTHFEHTSFVSRSEAACLGFLGTGLSVACFYYFGFRSLICSPSLTGCFCILKGRLFQYSALTVLGQGLAR